jgi:hypothetical protein
MAKEEDRVVSEGTIGIWLKLLVIPHYLPSVVAYEERLGVKS